MNILHLESNLSIYNVLHHHIFIIMIDLFLIITGDESREMSENHRFSKDFQGTKGALYDDQIPSSDKFLSVRKRKGKRRMR